LVWPDVITNPELPFQEHWGRAEDATLFGGTVKVASLQTLRLLLAASPEPKHAEDRALLERVLGGGAVHGREER
jgi:hypothetical protein